MTRPTIPTASSERSEHDELADQITIGVLIEAFSLYGIRPLAFLMAERVIARSAAFETGEDQ